MVLTPSYSITESINNNLSGFLSVSNIDKFLYKANEDTHFVFNGNDHRFLNTMHYPVRLQVAPSFQGGKIPLWLLLRRSTYISLVVIQ